MQADLSVNDLLFVYGSLIPATPGPMKDYVSQNCEKIDEAWIAGVLSTISGFPALIVRENTDEKVHGVLLRLKNPAENLKALDHYEGIGPAYPEPWEYRRELHQVCFKDGSLIIAWVYVLNGPYCPKSLTTN